MTSAARKALNRLRPPPCDEAAYVCTSCGKTALKTFDTTAVDFKKADIEAHKGPCPSCGGADTLTDTGIRAFRPRARRS